MNYIKKNVLKWRDFFFLSIAKSENNL